MVVVVVVVVLVVGTRARHVPTCIHKNWLSRLWWSGFSDYPMSHAKHLSLGQTLHVRETLF